MPSLSFQHFKQLQKDFINDDHERGISIIALSVQIFTVPTLVGAVCCWSIPAGNTPQYSLSLSFSLISVPVQARQLIEEANVIKVIVDTVMELLHEHLDANNRFFFLGYNSDKFSRIQFIFHDLRLLNRKEHFLFLGREVTNFSPNFWWSPSRM